MKLNQAEVEAQTDSLTKNVGAASQSAQTSVAEAEAQSFDTEVAAFLSQLNELSATSQPLHLPVSKGGLKVGSAEQRHVAVPWTA